MNARSRWWAGGLAVAGVIVVLASLFASADPDGLERVAADRGLLGLGLPNPFDILPDYTVPGIDGPVSTILAGLIGVAVLFVLLWLIGRGLARRD